MKTGINKEQTERFKQGAREAGADMSKEEFARVIGKVAKPKPQTPAQESDSDDEQTVDE